MFFPKIYNKTCYKYFKDQSFYFKNLFDFNLSFFNIFQNDYYEKDNKYIC